MFRICDNKTDKMLIGHRLYDIDDLYIQHYNITCVLVTLSFNAKMDLADFESNLKD